MEKYRVKVNGNARLSRMLQKHALKHGYLWCSDEDTDKVQCLDAIWLYFNYKERKITQSEASVPNMGSSYTPVEFVDIFDLIEDVHLNIGGKVRLTTKFTSTGGLVLPKATAIELAKAILTYYGEE